MKEHEKRIRDFLSERSNMRGLCPEQITGANDNHLNVSDLRALLADLDAMRADAQRYRYLRDVAWGDGSLVYFDHRYDKDEWDGKIDAALAALKGAEA